MKVGGGILGGQSANVVGDVEIEGVGAGALDADVFGVWSEGLEFGGKVEGHFGLVGAAEDLGFEWPPTERSQVLGLNVLEVDKDDVRFQAVDDRFGGDSTSGQVR